ncbi:MAG: hypothetical protein RLZZ07_547 [Actinomycetota bacterium]|jgi:uncharacterized protein YoxC
MSAGGIAAIIAASALVIVAISVAYAVIRFSKVLDEAGTAIKNVTTETVPLLEEVTTTVELTNRQLERVDNLTKSVESMANKLTSSADSILSKGSAAKLAGVAWGIAKAARKKKN